MGTPTRSREEVRDTWNSMSPNRTRPTPRRTEMRPFPMPSGEPARLASVTWQPSLSQPGHPLFFYCNGSHGGCSRSGHE